MSEKKYILRSHRRIKVQVKEAVEKCSKEQRLLKVNTMN